MNRLATSTAPPLRTPEGRLRPAHFDVFNGDADGICGLHQLRLAHPVESVLVTGVKRDIGLLARVDAASGDKVTVLDVSADVNHAALARLLERGVDVEYFDHHYAGELPTHPNLRSHIDTSPAVCTSLLVDRYLGGLHRLWAIVGAFGDNLARPAHALADALRLPPANTQELHDLGELLAYNAYGDDEGDLVVHPAQLYLALRPYADPFAFVHEEAICRRLAEQKREDLDRAALAMPELALPGATLYILPDEPWTRRVRGLLANGLANQFPGLAHAVLSPNRSGGYTVSVRAPEASPSGADAVCRKFTTGGGRVAAAGINHLAPADLPRFVSEMDRAFSSWAA